MTNWKKVPVKKLAALSAAVERIEAFQKMCEADEYTDTTLAHELLADVADNARQVTKSARASK